MSAAAAVTWFQLESLIRPALTAAKLSPESERGLLARHGVERVEDLPAARARDFVASVAEAAPGQVWVPPAVVA